jgi:hypothetical protein
MRSERLFGSPAGSRAPAAQGDAPVAAARRCPRSGSGHEMAPLPAPRCHRARAAYSRCGIPRPARSPRPWCCRRRSLPGASVPPPQSLRSGSVAGRAASGTHRDLHPGGEHETGANRLGGAGCRIGVGLCGTGSLPRRSGPPAPAAAWRGRSQAVTSARPGPAAQLVVSPRLCRRPASGAGRPMPD